MKNIKSPDGMRVEEVVDKKNPLADVMEAAEYAFWGGGEATELVRPAGAVKPKPINYNRNGGGSVWRSRAKGR